MAGIYIHIPFCRQACHYCNFHFSTSLVSTQAMIDAIHKEILLTPHFENEPTIETIYFGGGTPSLLRREQIGHILSVIHEKFSVNENAEISLEANPDDINETVLNDWLRLGINRLSLGVQSFDEAELKWMNRAHDAVESFESIRLIQAAGFTNFSVDLIYGSPLLSNEAFEENLRTVIEKRIPHISAYALTVEDRTALAHQIKKHQSPPVDEARQNEQFDILLKLTREAGYEQYEISNFAKPGFRSKHNSSYWTGKPYYGFGPSAHSYDGKNNRQWNIANNALYMQSLEKNIIPTEQETLSDTQSLNEAIMIGLRTMEGINLAQIAKRYGIDQSIALQKNAEKFLSDNLLKIESEHLSLTTKGKFLADGIAADLFFED